MITERTKAAMKTTIKAKHMAYAYEARQAEHADDWTSAAQLWTLAAESTRLLSLIRHYEAQAKRCNRVLDDQEKLTESPR